MNRMPHFLRLLLCPRLRSFHMMVFGEGVVRSRERGLNIFDSINGPGLHVIGQFLQLTSSRLKPIAGVAGCAFCFNHTKGRRFFHFTRRGVKVLFQKAFMGFLQMGTRLVQQYHPDFFINNDVIRTGGNGHQPSQAQNRNIPQVDIFSLISISSFHSIKSLVLVKLFQSSFVGRTTRGLACCSWVKFDLISDFSSYSTFSNVTLLVSGDEALEPSKARRCVDGDWQSQCGYDQVSFLRVFPIVVRALITRATIPTQAISDRGKRPDLGSNDP